MNYFLFFLGQLGLMLQVRFFFQWIVEFFTSSSSEMLISVSSLGAVLFGFRIFDAVTDPMAGIWSDNLSKKNISRKKLLPYSALLIPLGLVLCFLSDPSNSYGTNLVFILLGMFLFFSGYTIYCIPYWSLVDEFSGDNEFIKSKLSSLLGQGLFVATAISFVLSPILVSNLGILNACLVTILFSTPMLYGPLFCKFKENNHTTLLPNHRKNSNSFKFKDEYKKGFLSIILNFKRREFLRNTILFVGSQMAFTIMTALSAKYVVNILNKDINFIAVIMGPVIITSILTFFFVPKLKKNYEYFKLIKYSNLLLGILFLLTWLVYFDIGPKLILAPIIFGLMGFPLAVILGLEGLGVIHSAENKESVSTCFGAFNLLVKTFNGIAIWTSSLAVSGLIPNQEGIQLALSLGGVLCILPCFIYSSSSSSSSPSSSYSSSSSTSSISYSSSSSSDSSAPSSSKAAGSNS